MGKWVEQIAQAALILKPLARPSDEVFLLCTGRGAWNRPFADLPQYFGHAADRQLFHKWGVADRICAAFAAFAKTGYPSTPELPWLAYNAASRPTMLCDVHSGVKNDPDHDLLALLPLPGPPRYVLERILVEIMQT